MSLKNKYPLRFVLYLVIGVSMFMIGVDLITDGTRDVFRSSPHFEKDVTMSIISFALSGFNFFLVYRISKK